MSELFWALSFCILPNSNIPCYLQAWGSEGSIQQLPVQQQAYMTAALIKCLQLLGREQLESTPGLFPALLTGVSARLDSPEGPLRQVTQASVLDLSHPGNITRSHPKHWHMSQRETLTCIVSCVCS